MNTRNTSTDGHVARKRFGQHFLHDPRVLSRIGDAITRGNPCNVLEIGPGLGALTEVLLSRLPRLVAVELDRDLVSALQKRFSPEQLTVHQMDVLRCDLGSLDRPCPGQPFRVVGNLPYNISTPLIFHLLDQLPQIESMLFMVQKEVAQRLVAAPGSKAYGRLSLMASLDLEMEVLFDVPPGAFNPPPRVDSSVIRLAPRASEESGLDRTVFSRLVSSAFAQRRKTLKNTLDGLVTAEQFEAADIAPSLRAEALSLQDFTRLARVVSQQT